MANSLPKPRSCEACDIIVWSSSYTCQGEKYNNIFPNLFLLRLSDGYPS